MKSIYTEINQCYDELSEAEQEVIDFILRYEDINHLKMKHIKEELFLSNATIIRACKKLNYATFNQLKYAIVENRKDKEQNTTTTTDFLGIVEGIKKDTLTTLELVDEQQLDAVCNCLVNARRIFCVGTGSSSQVALEFNRKLKLFDFWSNSYLDHFSIERISQIIQKQDAVIMFSLSGEVQEINEVMIKVKSRGAKIIAITNISANRLKMISDYSLLVYSSPSSRKRARSRLMLFVMSALIYEKLISKVSSQE